MSTLQANSIVNGEGGSLPQFITRPFQNWYLNRNDWDNKFNQLYSDIPAMSNDSGQPTTILGDYVQYNINRTYNVWYQAVGGDSVIVVDIDYVGAYNYMYPHVTWDATYANYDQWYNNTYWPYGGASTIMFLVPRGSYWRVYLGSGGNPNVKEYKIGIPETNATTWTT